MRAGGGTRRKAIQLCSDGADGDKPVSPAKVQLKKLADRLSEEDAGLVLTLARKIASMRRNSAREAEDREDLEDARAARAEAAAKGTIPWEQVKARHGL